MFNVQVLIDSIDHNECTEEQFHATNNFLNCEITRFKESNLHYAIIKHILNVFIDNMAGEIFV